MLAAYTSGLVQGVGCERSGKTKVLDGQHGRIVRPGGRDLPSAQQNRRVLSFDRHLPHHQTRFVLIGHGAGTVARSSSLCLSYTTC